MAANQSTSNQRPVCIITGGSSGIGLSTAIRYAQAGYDIGICGRQPNALATAKDQILAAGQAHNIQVWTQVADLEDVAQAIQFAHNAIARFGCIDVLVNNAAATPLAVFESITAEDFEAAVNINIRSTFYLTQVVWKQMKQQVARELSDRSAARPHRGLVVNISSLAAVDPFPGFSLYGGCKAWLELITVSLAAEGKTLGMRVCAIRPGAVETPLLRKMFPDFPPEQCVSPEEIAEAVWGCVHQADVYRSGQVVTIAK